MARPPKGMTHRTGRTSPAAGVPQRWTAVPNDAPSRCLSGAYPPEMTAIVCNQTATRGDDARTALARSGGTLADHTTGQAGARRSSACPRRICCGGDSIAKSAGDARGIKYWEGEFVGRVSVCQCAGASEYRSLTYRRTDAQFTNASRWRCARSALYRPGCHPCRSLPRASLPSGLATHGSARTGCATMRGGSLTVIAVTAPGDRGHTLGRGGWRIVVSMRRRDGRDQPGKELFGVLIATGFLTEQTGGFHRDQELAGRNRSQRGFRGDAGGFGARSE